MSNQITLSKYAFCEETNSIIPFSDCKKTDIQIWDSLMPTIHQVAQQHGMKKSKTSNQTSSQDTPQPETILLFLKSRHLNSHRLFKALLDWNMRTTSTSSQSGSNFSPENAYWPVISISLTDITSLHTEEKGEKGQKEQDWNELTYKTFRHDSRIKFLDSSIWHRFVSIQSIHGTFEVLLNEVLLDIKQYHDWGLYYSNAANVTLEFQLRMLQNSYIAKMGDRGHAEVVTPFKFHSEGQMKRKANEEINFLLKEWPFEKKGKKITQYQSLLETLRWRLLIVDDQANNFISSLKNKPNCKVTKKHLIKIPFVKAYKIKNNRIEDKITLKDKIEIATPDSMHVIDWVCEKLEQKTFDILFLDYLLGDKPKGSNGLQYPNRREYGFEFLQKLLEDNRDFKPKYRRDFSGKYWIFPISSFPHALLDKLSQLGISYLHELWHISQGGDPITSPNLFAYNLYRFIKLKIGEIFLYPAALRRFLNQALIHQETPNDKSWIKYLEQSIKNINGSIEVFCQLNLNDEKSSLFVCSMYDFITSQRSIYFKKLIEYLLTILTVLQKEKEATQINLSVKKNIEKIKELPLDAEFKVVLDSLFERIEYWIDASYAEAKDKVLNNGRKNHLDLVGRSLTRIPIEIQKLKGLRLLYLSNNELSQLPDCLEYLYKVTFIDLNDNKFQYFPEVLYKMENLEKILLSDNQIAVFDGEKLYNNLPNLSSLNLKNNPLPLIKKIANNREEVKEICELMSKKSKELPDGIKYHLGLSFAGENREYVEEVYQYLVKWGYIVAYDKDIYKPGMNIEEKSSEIYGKICNQIIVFISEFYKKKDWPRYERDIIVDAAKQKNNDYIIPVFLDNTKIVGISKYAYLFIDGAKKSPLQTAQLIKEKILKNT